MSLKDYPMSLIESLMKEALIEAQKAYDQNEVPIGAVIFDGEKIVGRGFNQVEKRNSALSHAECIAIEDASRNVKNFRLSHCLIFSTIEPCTMCLGAILNARIEKIFYGCGEPITGALGSKCDLLHYHPNLKAQGGILEEECRELIQSFFKNRRREAKV